MRTELAGLTAIAVACGARQFQPQFSAIASLGARERGVTTKSMQLACSCFSAALQDLAATPLRQLECTAGAALCSLCGPCCSATICWAVCGPCLALEIAVHCAGRGARCVSWSVRLGARQDRRLPWLCQAVSKSSTATHSNASNCAALIRPSAAGTGLHARWCCVRRDRM